MYSTRDELQSVGALHQHLRRAGSRSSFQCSLRLCNPGPANGQNMAAAYVTQEETGRMCGILGGSIVNLPFPCLFTVDFFLIGQQRLYLKSTSTGVHHSIHSRRRRYLSIDVCGFLGVCIALALTTSSSPPPNTCLSFPFRVAEVTSAVACGCLPVLPLLFRQHIPKLKSSLISSFRRMRQRSSDTSHVSKDSRPGTFDRALIKNNYVELYERGEIEG